MTKSETLNPKSRLAGSRNTSEYNNKESGQILNPKSQTGFSFSFDFLIEILFLVVVFLIPVIFDRRLGIVFSGTKVAFLRSLVIVILGAWLTKLIITREHKFIRSYLDWPVLGFLSSTTIATLTSVHVYTSFVGFYGRFEGLTTWYLFGLLFFIGTNYIKSFEQFKRVIIAVTSAATLMAVYSVIQRHELDPYMWGGVVTWQRVIGMIGQPNFLAAYMLMAFFLTLVLFMLEKNETPSLVLPRTRDISVRGLADFTPLGYFFFVPAAFLIMIYTLEAQNIFLWYLGFSLITASALLFAYTYEKLPGQILDALLGLCLILNYICILYTQSRGGYMGFFTGGVLFLAVAGRKWIFSNWEKLTILGVLIVLISGITMSRPEFSPFERFTGEVTTKKEVVEGGEVEAKLELRGAAGSRGETWKSAFKIISDYPFFGIGPEVLKMVFPRYETELFRFKETFHVKQDRCHNETFDVPVTKGLISFLLYLWIVFSVFKIGLQNLQDLEDKKKLMLAGILAAILSYLIQNQFSFGVVAITSLFWIIWAMAVNLKTVEEHLPAPQKLKVSLENLPYFSLAGIILLASILIYISFISFRADILFKSGKTYLEMRRLPEAISELRKSLEIYPFEGVAISHLAISYLNFNQIDEAVKTLKYGTGVDPYNADNFYMLSKVYLMQGKDAEAFQAAEIAIKIDPYYAEVYHILGLFYEKEGKLEEAVKYFERAFFINPNLVEPMDKMTQAYSKMRHPEGTLNVFKRAAEKYADNFLILERVGKLYLDFRKLAEAEEIGLRMVKLDPKNSSGFSFLGEVYFQKGDLESAFSSFQQAFLIDPKNVSAHNGLGMVYLGRGDKAKAKEEFEQSLTVDPNNQVAKDMLRKL